MRSLVVLTIIVIPALAFALYHIEQEVEQLRGALIESNRQLQVNLDEIHVLKAEWTYLTQPKRLQEMAKKYLQSDTIHISHVKNVETIALQSRIVAERSVEVSGLLPSDYTR